MPSRREADGDPFLCRIHVNAGLSPTAVLILFVVLIAAAAQFFWPEMALFFWSTVLLLLACKRRLDMISFSDRKRISPVWMSPSYKVSFAESMRIDFTLGVDGPYCRPGPRNGVLSVAMKESPKSGKRGMKRFNRKATQIHCGFMKILSGNRSEFLRDAKPWELPSEKALPIQGPKPAGFEQRVASGREFGIKLEYTWAPAANPDSWAEAPSSRQPFWIFPMRPGSEANASLWGMELRIADPMIARLEIKSLRVAIPPELEGIEWTDGVYEGEKREVSWQNLRMAQGEPCQVSIQFRRALHQAKMITGSYQVEGEGFTLSGLKVRPKELYGATGNPVEEGQVTVSKTVKCEGNIQMDMRLQLMRKEFSRIENRTFEGVRLSGDMAHSIIECLSTHGVYAKYVFEAPPTLHIGDEGAYFRRYWEIIGRHYMDYHPFDVHVILTGKEPMGGEKANQEPDLHLELVVRSHSRHGVTEEESQEKIGYPLEIKAADSLAKDLRNAIGGMVERREAHATGIH